MTPTAALTGAVVVLLLWGVPGPSGGCGGPMTEDPAALEDGAYDGGSGGIEQSAYVMVESMDDQDGGTGDGGWECEEVELLPLPPQ